MFRCSYDKNGDVSIEKAAPGATGQNVYYLRRLLCVHPSHSGFRRILAFICGTPACVLLSGMMSSLYTIFLNNLAPHVWHPLVLNSHTTKMMYFKPDHSSASNLEGSQELHRLWQATSVFVVTLVLLVTLCIECVPELPTQY